MIAADFIANEIKTRIATSPLAAVQNGNWYQYIKHAQQQLALMYNWNFWQTSTVITISSGEAALPSTFKAQPVSKKGEAGKPPSFVDTTVAKNLWGLVELEDYSYQEDTKLVWAIDYLSAKIYAKTDGDYTLFYSSAPAVTVVQDTAILGLTNDSAYFMPLIDALADLVVSRAFQLSGKMDLGTMFYRQAQSKIKQYYAKTRNRV
jgi:hypothetical protein